MTDRRIDDIRQRLVCGKARNWTTTYPPELQGWADFVANAPDDISYLLDVIAERDAEIARLRRENKNVLNAPDMRAAYLSQFGDQS